MKKMKFTAALAAFISVFAFSSCLNDDFDESKAQSVSFATVNQMMGVVSFTPDEVLDKKLVPTNPILSEFGITSSSRRALIVYSYPEKAEEGAKTVNIQLERGTTTWPIADFSDRPDTCGAYTASSQFTNYTIGFTNYPALMVLNKQFLQVGYTYRSSKTGTAVMLKNRVSNDTLYFDMKFKNPDALGDPILGVDCYDLASVRDMLMEATPNSEGKLHITVKADKFIDYGMTVMKDSITTEFKPEF